MPKYSKDGGDTVSTSKSGKSSAASTAAVAGKGSSRASKKLAAGSDARLKNETTVHPPASAASVEGANLRGSSSGGTDKKDKKDDVAARVEAIDEDDAPSVGEQEGEAEELELEDADRGDRGLPHEDDEEDDEAAAEVQAQSVNSSEVR